MSQQKPPPKSRIPPPSSTLRTRSSTSSLSSTTSTTKPKVINSIPGSPTLTKPRPLIATTSKLSTSTTPSAPKRTPSTPSLRTATSSSRLNSSASTRPPAPRTPTTNRVRSPTKPALIQKPVQSLDLDTSPRKTALSIKEQIALKRAEAQKAALKNKKPSTSAQDGNVGEAEELDEGGGGKGAETEDLGRWTVKESIERARTTGILNLSSRTFAHLPASLFTIHLGITPDRLPSQADEPLDDPKSLQPNTHLAYYEIVDLVTLKLRNNTIVALHPELSMFGSLKSLDLHDNKLKELPPSLSDLGNLTHLDLSKNAFEVIPRRALDGMISLINLDLSHNALSEFNFGANDQQAASQDDSTSFFSQSPTTTSPLPSLQILSLAFNKITTSSSISLNHVPINLSTLNLSGNPLSKPTPLLGLLAKLPHLKELSMRQAQLEEGTFVSATPHTFPALTSLDVGENGWLQREEVVSYLVACGKTVDPSAGGVVVPRDAVRLTWGKKDTREAWEIELEAQRLAKFQHLRPTSSDAADDRETSLVIGQQANNQSDSCRSAAVAASTNKKVEVPKEQWEIDMEEGVHTEAGRLRKRLEAMELEHAKEAENLDQPSETLKTTALSKYYDARLLALKLPSCKPSPARAGHARAVSLKVSNSTVGGFTSAKADDLNLPLETMPLSMVASHSWAANLKVMTLSNRRADALLDLGLCTRLERLEELSLDGCSLGDSVRVRRGEAKAEGKETLFMTLHELFPNLATLDLSENNITHLPPVICKMFFPENGHGLKVLRVRGNRINDLEGLIEVAERFGRGESDGWKGEEVDIRDNDVGKLAPVLGHLQLDVFLVEGNSFRVPQRSVWQRDGTRGLLRWLKDSG